MHKIILQLLLIFTFVSCSIYKNNRETIKDDVDFSKRPEHNSKDYGAQFRYLKTPYLNTSGVKALDLRFRSQIYLEQIATQIEKQNELFFTSKDKARFTIINSQTPFHFSLPGKNIFISSGLISKYIKSEKLLYCLIAYELIRSEKEVYRKQLLIPTGFMTTEKLLSMMRLGINDKVELHKWAFYLLKRVGIDTDNYLSWLQIQNRNSIDFSMQLGDISVISREEALFKAFIVKNTSVTLGRYHEGSSRGFYAFINNIKR